MNGKMTTSRMGIIGNFLVSNFSLEELTQYSSLLARLQAEPSLV
jgi:hypothetical protein